MGAQLIAGKYEVEGEADATSASDILAQDITTGRRVIIRAPMDRSGSWDEFKSQIQLISKNVNHPNIVTIWDYLNPGVFGSSAHVVYEALPFTLTKVLDGESLSISATKRHLDSVFEGLRALHKVDLCHNWMSTDSIYLSADSSDIKIGSFEFVSRTGDELATLPDNPKFAAPETYGIAYRCDPRSDLYSLGLIAYIGLVGQARLQQVLPEILGQGDQDIAEMWRNWHIDRTRILPLVSQLRPEIPSAVSGVIAKLLAKEPSDRFLDATSACQAWNLAWSGNADASAYASPGAIVLDPDNIPEQKRSRLPLIAGIAAVLVVWGGVGAYLAYDNGLINFGPTVSKEQMAAANAAAVEARKRAEAAGAKALPEFGAGADQIALAINLVRDKKRVEAVQALGAAKASFLASIAHVDAEKSRQEAAKIGEAVSQMEAKLTAEEDTIPPDIQEAKGQGLKSIKDGEGLLVTKAYESASEAFRAAAGGLQTVFAGLTALEAQFHPIMDKIAVSRAELTPRNGPAVKVYSLELALRKSANVHCYLKPTGEPIHMIFPNSLVPDPLVQAGMLRIPASADSQFLLFVPSAGGSDRTVCFALGDGAAPLAPTIAPDPRKAPKTPLGLYRLPPEATFESLKSEFKNSSGGAMDARTVTVSGS